MSKKNAPNKSAFATRSFSEFDSLIRVFNLENGIKSGNQLSAV